MKAKLPNVKNTHANKRIAIVASLFNEYITQRLLTSCLKELASQGVLEKNIKTVWVPGSFEIPVTALKFAKRKEIDAVICLGAIIRGETFHFELVSQSVAQGIMQVSLMCQKPVIFGVLSTDTMGQAEKRSEINGDNKGRDAAITALTMIDLLGKI